MKGPLFDGRAEAAIRDYTTDVAHTLGQEGVTEVKTTLHTVLRHPTGNYESHINSRDGGNTAVVNDRGIIYGPWLEGTGSRNRTTRFKGYATFRLVRQQLQGKSGEIAKRLLAKYIGRMN